MNSTDEGQSLFGAAVKSDEMLAAEKAAADKEQAVKSPEVISKKEFDKSEVRRIALSEINGRKLSDDEKDEYEACIVLRQAYMDQQSTVAADKEEME